MLCANINTMEGVNMKITADGLLGQAQKINNQKKTETESSASGIKEARTDSVSIGKIVNSRVESIEKEIRELQTSLAKNQSINNGTEQLDRTLTSGGNAAEILEKNTFNGKQVLKDFIGPEITPEIIKLKKDEIRELIKNDIAKLTRVQVELDNIIASDLAGSRKVENLMAGLTEFFKGNPSSVDAISNLDAEKVMKLIR
jgi:hypothetical protein